MKKTLLSTFLCLLFMGSTASAQCFLSTASGSSSDTRQSIIRTVDQDVAISAFISDNYTRLVKLTSLTSGITITLDEGVMVNDMRVYGNMVYFCGRKQNQGVYGRVNLDQFLPEGGLADIDYYYLPSAVAWELTRMVVYAYDDGVTLVAIGNRTTDGLFTDVIVTTKFDQTSFVVSNPNKHLDVTYAGHLEHINDIVEIGNYLVFVGNDISSNALAIHRCHKGNLFGDFANYHCFPYEPDEFQSKHRVCQVTGGHLGVVSMGYDGNSSSQYKTKFRQFDMMMMAEYNSQEFDVEGKVEPYEIVFMASDFSVILLQDMKVPGSGTEKSLFVQLKMLQNSNYIAPGLYELNGAQYNSIDRRSDSMYWASGGWHWMTKHLFNIPNSNACYDYGYVDVKMKEAVNSEGKNFIYELWSHHTNHVQEEKQVGVYIIQTVCDN